MSNHSLATQPAPKGWPRISASIFYNDAAQAIDWLCETFGFEVQLRVEGDGGRIVHSQLTFGDGLIMISDVAARLERNDAMQVASPMSIDGQVTQALALFVDDVDVHCEQARKAGARIAEEPTTQDYGEDYWTDRSYRAVDPEGHHWWFMQRLRSGKNA